MRGMRGFRRGGAISLAAAVGYLIGTFNASAPRSGHAPEPIYAQAAALRFHEDFAPPGAAQTAQPRIPTQQPMVLGTAQFALFEPAPTAPSTGLLQVAAAPTTDQSPTQPASTEIAELTPAMAMPAPQHAAPPVRVSDTPIEAAKRHPATPRLAKRPGYLFDDAQLARIKRRLHLTPDQERMWPAVAAALHNIGLEQERQARWRGQAGAIDPNGEAVRNLKSAAFPLLMSFSDEQKDEVRNLAHNMGLDQLASEF